MSKRNIHKLGAAVGMLLLIATLLLLPITVWAEGDALNPELLNTYYSVTAEADDPAHGTVEVAPSDSSKPTHTNEAGQFLYGTEVILTATPKTGYEFVKWTDGTATESPSNPLKIPVYKASSYTAHFRPIPYAIVLDYSGTVQYEQGNSLPEYHVYGQTTPLPIPVSDIGYTFKCWIANSEGIESREYFPGESLGASEYKATIHLTPVFEPNPYNVSCRDELADGTLLGTVTVPSHYNATVSPLDAAAADYRGYFFDPATVQAGDSITVTGNDSENVVKRLYQPKTFRILFKNCEKAAESFVYGLTSTITCPEREGYVFLGWRVENHGADGASYEGFADYHPYTGNSLEIPANAYDHSAWTYEGRESESVAIVLVAEWAPVEYRIDYQDQDGVSGRQHFSGLPTTRYYDDEVVFGAPARAGYTFLGWTILGSDAEPAMSLTLQKEATDLTLVAHWSVNSYEVTLEGGAEGVVMGTDRITVTFDAAFPQVEAHPTREGYTFEGFFLHGTHQSVTPYYYYDAERGEWVGAVWDIPENGTVLVAHWRINSYEISFDSVLAENAEITVNGQPYVAGVPFTFDFNTEITIELLITNGKKLVKWNGEAVAHTAQATFRYTVRSNATLVGAVANELSVPDFKVNYKNESLVTSADGIEAGSYRLICGSEVITFTVGADGVITFADGTTAVKLSAEPYLGKTVELIRCGDGSETSDSDACVLAVAGRPSAPQLNTDIDYISPYSYTIEIKMEANGTFIYEFACSTVYSADGSGLTWTTNSVFDNLRAGTPYYVYVRVAASETYPHGEIYVTEKQTLSKEYLQSMIDRLMELKTPEDGEHVNKLINDAVAAMEALQPSETYVESMEAIVNRVEDGIGFARSQDSAATQLKALHAELLATEAYSEELGIPKLDRLLAEALAGVASATTPSEVQRVAEEAAAKLYAVPISYLFGGEDLLLTASKGAHKDFRISYARVSNLVTITSLIERAVAAENIVIAGGTIALKDAAAVLSAKDVVGYYQLQLTHSTASTPKPEGPFTVRLLIPEDLRDETGLVVAYYQTGTDQITVLDTVREGNYLVFTADSVANFVILGDHTVDLRVMLAALSVILLAQLIAIAFLLIRRKQTAGDARLNSFLLPTMALSVRFFPENTLMLTLILGVAVILLQIVLMVLLLKSDVVAKARLSGRFYSPEEQKREENAPELTALSEKDTEALLDAEETDDPDLAFEPYVPEEETEELIADEAADEEIADEGIEPQLQSMELPEETPSSEEDEDSFFF